MPQPSWKVNEIFYSIQGEGRHTGMPAVFVRLAGCAMNCPFCDTKYAARDGETMSAPELLAALSAWPAQAVIITGGEPTEQDLPALIAVLKDAGYQVHLETNGAKDTDVSQADFVCVSPKKYVSAEMLKKADVIKIVVGQDTDLEDLQKYYAYENAHTQIYLQPESNKQENIDLCVKLLKNHPAARLSLQMHKLANIR